MIETVIAVMGLVSAGIFLAHAFEGYARPGSELSHVSSRSNRKSSTNLGKHRD
jgi:hypothetical protein